ncbi:MAG: SBBP repeat-containing protein, partial [Flavobacteriales bacterium]
MKYLIIVFSSLSCFIAGAQPYEQWVAIFNGGGADLGRAMVIDNKGNSYVAGTSDGTGTGRDCAVVKYDSLGNELWAARYNGPDSLDDWGQAVIVDDAGNVYLTGQTNTATAGADYITLKYDAQGNLQWARTYDGTASGSDIAVDVALDNAGNVFVTGKSEGTASMEDYVTVKYDNAGNQVWVQRYDGPGNNTDDARSIFVDKWNNIYVSGGSIGDTTDYDFATVKYNNAGNQQWVARYNGPGNAYDLVFYQGSVMVDSLGNVYIVGYSTGTDSLYEYAVVKYDSSGNQLWEARYAGDRMGKDDFTDAIALDDSLNVYITGAMYDSLNDYDFMTIKYDRNGNLKWTASYNGTDNGWDEAYGVVVDDTGNVFIGGRSNKANFSGADYVIVKYDSSGNEVWNVRYSR